MRDIFDKIENHLDLEEEDVLSLLKIENGSYAYYRLLYYAQAYALESYQGRGYVFAQIGMNAEPCSVNCTFCSMAASHYQLDGEWRKSKEQIIREVKELVRKGASDLFLMTTADYPQFDFLEVGKEVRRVLPENVRLVANIGDFTHSFGLALREAGFTGVYHIIRLREGVDTGESPGRREETIAAIQEAGLELYYCVEPIGPEHSYPELAKEMFRAKEWRVNAMAVMRRTPIAGTPLCGLGKISTSEICKIAAVTLLVVRPSRSMNVHEVTEMSLLAGVNQLYAESGANPRDIMGNTELNRGYSVEAAIALLNDFGYEVK